jgi:predicted outer membrane protein
VREPRAAAPGRQQLETRLRQRLWNITKNRVGFTDEQMSRLAQTSRGFDERRRRLAIDERQQRQLLRREILAGSGADQSRVAAALDRMLQIQRERVDLQSEEQRAFAEFMTPVQRARYAALQEQLRRRAERLRAQRAGADSTLGLDDLR